MSTTMDYVATDARAYERSMGRWSRLLAEPFLDALALAPDQRVLDAGCGTGALSAALLERDPGAKVTGVDLGQAYVEAARVALPQARFERGDILSLPLPTGSQDAALALLVLAFVPDPLKAVREMARVTRPGGVVATAMWDFAGGFPFLRLFADTAAVVLREGAEWRDKHWADPIGTPGRLGALFEAAGIRNARERDISIRQEFSGFEDWWEPWLRGQGIVGAFATGLEPPARSRLEGALRRAWGVDGPRSFVATARMVTGEV
ncbi:methyltransferase domain-containing protein [Roseococcus sp. SYP-B2431]|uniref:class I SAM-dependent methyltransferase n=1 Tax=Roseococcus sp. SYP-B2431 TaxID=2496640 RepID=UPI00103877CD|nr:class I SAM-dependent methyltransferase [Roseococcus sp. SYP-B2431]TCI00807.1 methyltransferase domain-containing protein [Roseococcus sp. SYP-B2431]